MRYVLLYWVLDKGCNNSLANPGYKKSFAGPMDQPYIFTGPGNYLTRTNTLLSIITGNLTRINLTYHQYNYHTKYIIVYFTLKCNTCTIDHMVDSPLYSGYPQYSLAHYLVYTHKTYSSDLYEYIFKILFETRSLYRQWFNKLMNEYLDYKLWFSVRITKSFCIYNSKFE